LIWGLRFVLHIGSERAFGRLMFLPIAVALSSVYAASIVPIKTWEHGFGMGGLFGDTIVGSLLTLVPISVSNSILMITVCSLFLAIILNLFCSGFVGSEIRKIVGFLCSSLKITYSYLLVIFV
jgi:S-DNA-T family DNA segregation ATPase FtsK/SpoIIIE